MNIRHSVLCTALAFALATPAAHALGLGQLQVKSGLNQPLVAEIPIISATPSEIDQLDVRLASPDAFERVGLERPGYLTANLQFSIGKNSRGQPVVRVTTVNKFSEPFLSFLLEADWGKGAVTREYTALIDPPYIAPAIIRPMATPSVAAMPVPAQTPAPAPEPPPAPAQPVAETMPVAEPEPTTVAPVAAAPVPAPPPVEVAAQAPPPKSADKLVPKPAAPAPKPAPPAPAPAKVVSNQYGPVASGQTLWSIATSVKPDDSVTMNQMMLALLHANPDAFDGDNVNRLKKGSVLRIPSREEAMALTATQAAALVHEQASAWRASRKPVPQPAQSVADTKSESTTAKPTRPVASQTGGSKSRSRLEIVPPSGKSGAQAAQSGAASGAGGTELRAELTQAREDLAARTAEVTELKSRVADLEQINDKQQKMIQVQDSEMKALQDRLKTLEQQSAQAPAAATAPAATEAPAKAEAKTPAKPAAKDTATPEPVAESPWYMNPLYLGAGVVVLLFGLVAMLRRGRRKAPADEATPPPARRISEDDALHATLAKNKSRPAKVEEPQPAAKSEPTISTAATPASEPAPAPIQDTELSTLNAAIRSRPQDLESHLSLLRYYHKRGDASSYEAAAQVMRLHVPSVMDPRWREAVVLGSSLLPGHPLFSQAGWNTPRFNEPAAREPAAPEPAAAVASPPVAEPEPMPEPAFEMPPSEPAILDDMSVASLMEETSAPEPVHEIDFEPVVESGASDEMEFGPPGGDLHRNEAELMAEDEASATRIELAKAYLDIGDLDGARSMLEEVLTDGSPLAKSEAERILKEIG